MLQIKRIYEAWDEADGRRVLVDRLWPRGVRKEVAHVDVWMKDVAPSPDLRTWFHHDVSRFPVFQVAYEKELVEEETHRAAVKQLLHWLEQGSVTLLYAAKDPLCNHAVVLRDYVRSQPLEG